LIATLFDSTRTFEQIAEVITEKFGVQASVESINAFYEKLDSIGFIEKDGALSVPTEPDLWQKRPLLQKILYFKIKAFNPDRFLESSLPYVRWMYSPFMIPLYVALTGLAVITLFSNRLELSRQLTTIGPGTIPLIYLTVIFVTILHELSHGYACKLYGGKVSEMGFLMLYFFLYFYTNVSDAYLFPEKKKRLTVSAAGIQNQVVVWALAMIVWRLMAPETIFNRVAFIIVTISFVGIIFNLNPLLKLDGYYYLVDKLGIPNLRARAFRYWKQRVFRLISPGQPKVEYPPRETKIYSWYGLAAIAYSGALFGYVLYKFSGFIFSRTGILGMAILYLLVLYIVFEALKKSGFWKLVMSERGSILRPRSWIIFAVALAGIVFLSVIIKMELKISQDCLIYPIESLTIRSSDAGYVELVLDRGSGEKNVQRLNLAGQDMNVMSIEPTVEEGDYVKAGQLIARISSTESESQLAESRANLDRARSQLELLEKGPRPDEIAQTDDLIEQVRMKLEKSNADLARSQELSAKGMIPKDQLENDKTSNEILKSELSFYQKQKRLLKQGARPEELAIAEADIRAIEAKISRLETQLAANNISSPINGVVTSLKAGSDLLTVARIDTMRIRIPVPEKEISPVTVGQRVKLKARGFPGETFDAVVTKISGQTESGEFQPVIVATANAANTNGLMKPGMTGRAKIYCGKLPIYKVLLWRMVRWFRVEFWSWF